MSSFAYFLIHFAAFRTASRTSRSVAFRESIPHNRIGQWIKSGCKNKNLALSADQYDKTLTKLENAHK
jgi:hypothetical protein